MAATITPERTATELLNWTDLSDTGSDAPWLETAQVDISSEVVCLLNIDMAQDNTVAITIGPVWRAYGKTGSTDDDWHIFADGDYGTVSNALTDVSSWSSGEVSCGVTDTTHIEYYGQRVFIKHATLANSMVNTVVDYTNDNKCWMMDTPAVDFTNTADIMCTTAGDGVTTWPVRVPDEYWAAKVSFHNRDADAIFACRVQYNFITDYSSV